MYNCFYCGRLAVIWDSDFTFDELEYDGDGVVNYYHCTNCGAQIQYKIPYDSEEEE